MQLVRRTETLDGHHDRSIEVRRRHKARVHRHIVEQNGARAAFALAATAALTSGSALAATPITGNWVTPEKDAVITVAQCGRSICGKIARFLHAHKNGD